MPIEMTWADTEKTILVGTFTGDWTWQDYINTVPIVLEMLKGLNYRIDNILDMRESGPVPLGSALMNLHRSDKATHYEKTGIIVIVGASAIMHGLESALAMTNPERSPRLFAESIEEAHTLIQNDRAKNKPIRFND